MNRSQENDISEQPKSIKSMITGDDLITTPDTTLSNDRGSDFPTAVTSILPCDVEPEKTIKMCTPEGNTSGNAERSQELPDQTNLLPMKQLLIVFSGLSAAMFCSMLNQTMYVSANSNLCE